ncbi:hypothetical protein [Qaidamihabitans albus]|uniref:hypothetical protein n=1 Tax=Qaidamihabitans albus TaxID=2795733 RepID=UPI0018F18B60|nr:hypothetical protein [Qaidamihabitans albus]
MHDRHRTGRGTTVSAEDVIDDDILADEMVDDEYLREVFREPRQYLPPPRMRFRRREPKPPREPETAFARRAKLIGLILAIALLTGSVVAAAVLGDDPGGPRSSGSAERPEITGAAALGGFVRPADDTPRTGFRPAAEQVAAMPATSPTGRQPDPTPAEIALHAAREAATEPAATEQPGQSGRSGEPGRLDIVREFYELVGRSPQDALALLDPELAGDTPGDLVRAWSTMRSVHVEDLREQPDGTVRAVVTMVAADGSPLRVTQLLELTEGTGPRINGATLLATPNE